MTISGRESYYCSFCLCLCQSAGYHNTVYILPDTPNIWVNNNLCILFASSGSLWILKNLLSESTVKVLMSDSCFYCIINIKTCTSHWVITGTRCHLRSSLVSGWSYKPVTSWWSESSVTFSKVRAAGPLHSCLSTYLGGYFSNPIECSLRFIGVLRPNSQD